MTKMWMVTSEYDCDDRMWICDADDEISAVRKTIAAMIEDDGDDKAIIPPSWWVYPYDAQRAHEAFRATSLFADEPSVINTPPDIMATLTAG